MAVSIAISESGRSPETIAAFQQAEGFRIATTNVPDSPITQHADLVVGWGDVPDAGVLSGYTASLLALGALGDWLPSMACRAHDLDVAPWISAATRAVDALLLSTSPTRCPPPWIARRAGIVLARPRSPRS